MSNKKNKKDTHNKQSSLANGVTEEHIKQIEELKNDTGSLDASPDTDDSVLTQDDKIIIDESEKSGNIAKYLGILTQINKRLRSDQNKLEEDRKKLNQERDVLKKDQENFKIEKENSEERTKKLNEKEKDVLERELALDNGEYTSSIRNLLNTMTEAEKEVCQGTENLVKQLAQRSTEFHEKQNELLKEKEELADEKLNLEKEKKEFDRNKKKAKIEQEFDRENFEEELKAEYENKIKELETDKSILNTRYDNMLKQNNSLNQLKECLHVVLGETDADSMVEAINNLYEERERLQNELNKRPSVQDIEAKNKQISEILSANEELRSKLDEEELLKLRERLDLSGNYILEIHSLEQKIESAEMREGSLKRTIEDLQITVEQLRGERRKDETAFEFAKGYDSDDTLKTEMRKKQPKSLHDFANYIKKKLANKEVTPLFYDIDTIRTFIAGLFMSNISILQGISGTGKTSLPREFAIAMTNSDNSYIGLDSDKAPKAPYRICAVQSGWRDRMDLMGFYNSFEHKYRETEFFKALYLANTPKYRNTMFFIILDEMNLSQPEHYFADFLSLLEQDEDCRYIDVDGNEDVWPNLIKENKGKLEIPNNVRFIGTANHDETTLSFADKTYDRSNLMEMPKNYSEGNADKANETYCVDYEWFNSKFKEAQEKYKKECKKFTDFIRNKDVKELFSDKGLGTGNRFEKQASRFIAMYLACCEEKPEEKIKGLAKAADHLISSRLLRKIGDNYDLTKNSLQEFKNGLCKKFEKEFEKEPKKVSDMLDKIIETKQ